MSISLIVKSCGGRCVLTASITLLALSGCTTPGPHGPREQYVVRPFSAPLNQPLRVETGNSLFVSGTYIDGEEIVLTQAADMMIPGSMFIPFPVHIDAGILTLKNIGQSYKYYCAAEGRAAASFPGLGSVINRDDCVGIRIPLSGGEPEWVVDNSNHTRMSTIWTKSMTADERTQVRVRAAAQPFKVKDLTRILFDGFHGQKLHFTLMEFRDGRQESRPFTFDFTGEPTVVGIRGNQWEVLSANNLEIRYQWIKLANP